MDLDPPNVSASPDKNVDLDDYNPFDEKTQNQSSTAMNPTEDMLPAVSWTNVIQGPG